MNQLFTWLAMGGYSMYVWPAYGLVSAILVLNLFSVKRQKKQIRQQLRQWFKRTNA